MSILCWSARSSFEDSRLFQEKITAKLTKLDRYYEGSHSFALFTADFGHGEWILTMGNCIDKNCFHEVDMEAAGEIAASDWNAVLVLYGLRDILDVTFANERGDEIVFDDLSSIEKYFGNADEILAEAKRIGIFKPLKVFNDQHKPSQKDKLFF